MEDKTGWDLTREIITILGDIDRNLDLKSKTKDNHKKELIDKEIDKLELNMFEIKNKLKSIKF